MKLKKVFLLVAIIASFFLLATTLNVSVKATDKDSSFIVKVDHIAGNYEKIKERITLFFKFEKTKKADYHQYLAKKRLGELEFVINAEKYNSIEEVASRYSTYLGRLNEYVVEKNIESKKEELLEMYDKHEEIIDGLQQNFEFDSGWRLSLQWSEDTTNFLSNKLEGV